MYQGCNRTALCSQKSIADGFCELLKEKEYGKITVSEICKKSGVSRQTFYSLFSSKENIVSFILLNEYAFDPHEECHCCGRPTLKELSRGFSSFITEKRDFIDLLEKNNIIYLMQESLFNSLHCCNATFSGEQLSSEDASRSSKQCSSSLIEEELPPELIMDYVASGLTTIARYYVTTSKTITPSQLEKMIGLLFHGEYL